MDLERQMALVPEGTLIISKRTGYDVVSRRNYDFTSNDFGFECVGTGHSAIGHGPGGSHEGCSTKSSRGLGRVPFRQHRHRFTRHSKYELCSRARRVLHRSCKRSSGLLSGANFISMADLYNLLCERTANRHSARKHIGDKSQLRASLATTRIVFRRHPNPLSHAAFPNNA